jgi:predicted TIM-barrel fold metal-dependent hydrolase
MDGERMRVIDGDGHIAEVEGEINDFLEAPYGGRRSIFPLFPSLDGRIRRKYGMPPTSAAIWQELLDAMGLEATVVYPTAGLSLGLIQDPEWATVVARGYNSWLAATYLQADARIKGVALLPPQDVGEAARELERCVRDLGMVGGLLPAVTSDRVPFGDARFDPLYEAAQRLDTPLAIHGGPQTGLGLEPLPRAMEGHALAHPIPIFTHFVNMVLGGVYHRHPALRVAYLEAGAGWVPFWMDRLDYEVETHRSEWPYPDLPSDVIRGGRIYVSCEPEERSLPGVLAMFPASQILYASDFPHEIGSDPAAYVEDLHEFLERDDLAAADKQQILAGAAERLYGLRLGAAARG